MRPWLGFIVLAMAACATVPPPAAMAPAVTGAPGLDQGWSAADREQFATTPQGSYLMPLAWFQALRRTDQDAPFAADQLARYGYLPTRPAGVMALPVGFVRDGVDGDPQLGMTCAACHTGQIRYRGHAWRIDGGRANADFQAFLTDLGAAARATLADPRRLAAFETEVLGAGATMHQQTQLQAQFEDWTACYSRFMTVSLPNPPWGPGRLDAFGMIFNRVTGLDLQRPGNVQPADAPVRYPFIWDAPRQDRTQWTGAAPNGTYLRGMARNTGEVFGVFGRFDPVAVPVHQILHRNSVKLANLQLIEEKVVALRPPPWPRDVFGFDQARAVAGAQVFAANCAGCHAPTPSKLVRNTWNTPVQNVGTDRRTVLNTSRTASPGVLEGTQQPPLLGPKLGDPALDVDILANAVVGSLLRAALLQDPAIHRAINRDLAEDRVPLLGGVSAAVPAAAVVSATKTLYTAARQEPDAAYEARVLTGIWSAGPYLHNGSVPTLWDLLKPARERVTRFAVGGGEFDPVRVGQQTAPAGPGGPVFVVDASVGNGNDGHEYGTTLPEEQRWQLIEYLKTL